MLVLLLVTLLFGLQSLVLSTALANDINHSFSAAEHQNSETGISSFHDGCSAKSAPAPFDLLEPPPVAASSAPHPDLILYAWVATLPLVFTDSAPPRIVHPFAPPPATAGYATPVFRQDVLLI